MGDNIHAVVGRIRPNVQKTTGQEVLDISDYSKLTASMFEFLDCSSYDCALDVEGNVKTDIDIDYDLHAWLVNGRGSVKPIDGCEQVKDATTRFIAWIDGQKVKPILRGASSWDEGREFSALWELADGWSRALYPIDLLLGFDYTQVALVHDDFFYHEDKEVNTWKPEPEGKTYFDLFGHYFVPFLEEAKAKGWQFVIFYIT